MPLHHAHVACMMHKVVAFGVTWLACMYPCGRRNGGAVELQGGMGWHLHGAHHWPATGPALATHPSCS